MENPLLKHFQFRHLDGVKQRWDAIRQYNASISGKLPVGAKAFALADWHYNSDDPSCPHDSWIQSLEIRAATSRTEVQGLRIKLLGAYHDREIHLDYAGIVDLFIVGQLVLPSRQRPDWLYDEVHLCDSGSVEHLIEFETASMRIECADLSCSSVLL